MSALLPWDEDTATELCGWCGHEHPRAVDCGCVPCPSCGGYHPTGDGEEDR